MTLMQYGMHSLGTFMGDMISNWSMTIGIMDEMMR